MSNIVLNFLKIKKKIMCLGVLYIFLFTIFVKPICYAQSSPEDIKLLRLFMQVFEEVEQEYVDEVDKEEMMNSALKGMLNSLDPYSTYLSERDFSEMEVDTKGFYGGLGLEITMDKNGFVRVVSPIDDTPAAKAKIMTGDFITAIDGEDVYGLSLDDAVKLMRGYANTAVTLTIFREGEKETFDIPIIREIIQITPVKFSVEDNIGYIRISHFNDIADKKVVSAIKEINEQTKNNVMGYIIDIRNNPGGLLEQAIKVTDLFLDKGEIVSIRTRNAERKKRFFAKKGDITDGAELVIIINNGSASASEIFSGALKDNKRATVIGEKTYGKGSVQTVIPLGRNNGAMRLTTAEYYSPSDKSIHKIGVEPNYAIPSEKSNDEEITNDTQLEFAKKLINARYKM